MWRYVLRPSSFRSINEDEFLALLIGVREAYNLGLFPWVIEAVQLVLFPGLTGGAHSLKGSGLVVVR